MKKKICIISTGLGIGGAEMMLYRLLKNIRKDKYEFLVISLLDSPGNLKKKIDDLGIKTISLNINNKLQVYKLIQLYRIIKKFSPDILHTQLFHANIFGRIIGKLLRVPHIISSIRNNKFKNNLRYKMMSLTDDFAEITTVVSKNAALDMINAGALSKAKSRVIYNGLDIKEFLISIDTNNLATELNLKKNIPTIISVGSLTKQKGYDILLDSLKILVDKGYNFNFLIAGEGNKREFIESKILKYNLSGKVKLLGRRDDIASLLSISDIFVLSSKWEGLPGVVIEAMSVGLPVIATNVGGVNEIIDNGKDGFIVPPNRKNELAEKIIEVMNLSVNDKEQFSNRAQKKIKEKFNIDKMVNNYESVYDSLLNNN